MPSSRSWKSSNKMLKRCCSTRSVLALVCTSASRQSIVQEGVNNETAIVTEKINRTKSRIVQDPERIKRNIATMSATVNEDKKTNASHEGKIRDLQAKITALLNIEKVCALLPTSRPAPHPHARCQDVRSCIEQLQMIEKESNTLDVSQKALADLRDQLDQKKGERLELDMRREVRLPSSPSPPGHR